MSTATSAVQPMAAGKQQASHRKRGRHHGDEADEHDGAPRSPPILTSESGRFQQFALDFVVVGVGLGGFSTSIFPLTDMTGTRHGGSEASGSGRAGVRYVIGRGRAEPIERPGEDRQQRQLADGCVHAAARH